MPLQPSKERGHRRTRPLGLGQLLHRLLTKACLSYHCKKTQHRLTHPLGLSELLHGLLEVGQRPFHQALVLLEVVQQHIPQRLLCQNLGVTQDD